MLTVVAIFKDEAPYIAEWILFHRMQGFDHFLLYDNGSSDDGPAIARILGAEVVYWPGEVRQLDAYHHALSHLPVGAWAAFIDIDEYLWSPDGITVKDVVNYRYTWQPALGIPWLMFGSNGHLHRPSGLTIESYVMRENKVNDHVKQLMIVDRQARFLDPHHTNIAYERTDPYIMCNHYWSRSVEEVERKFARGRADLNVKRSMNEFIESEQVNNAIQDSRLAVMYGYRLRLAMSADITDVSR